MEAGDRNITGLLKQWSAGDKLALDQLIELVYEDLRQLARRRARALPADSSIQPTALVNEVYLRLVDASQVSWNGRAHFFAIAARLMRQVVTDSARLPRPRETGRRLAANRHRGLQHPCQAGIGRSGPG